MYRRCINIKKKNLWNHKLQFMNLEWNDELSISRCLAVNQYSMFSRLCRPKYKAFLHEKKKWHN